MLLRPSEKHSRGAGDGSRLTALVFVSVGFVPRIAVDDTPPLLVSIFQE